MCVGLLIRTLGVLVVRGVLWQSVKIIFEQQLVARNPLNWLQHVMLQSQVPTALLPLNKQTVTYEQTKLQPGHFKSQQISSESVPGSPGWWSWTELISPSRCSPTPWLGQSSSHTLRTSLGREPASARCPRSVGLSPCRHRRKEVRAVPEEENWQKKTRRRNILTTLPSASAALAAETADGNSRWSRCWRRFPGPRHKGRRSESAPPPGVWHRKPGRGEQVKLKIKRHI